MILRSTGLHVCTFGVGALLLAGSARAQPHSPPITIAERAQGAAVVLVGTIESSVPLYRTNKYGDNLIVSQLSIRVSELVKGTTPGFVTLEIEGGTMNGITMRTSDLPELRTGDNCVFFLDRGSSGELTPHLRGYGLLRLSNGVVEHSSLTLDQIRAEVKGAAR
jgi:hypothetical protein